MSVKIQELTKVFGTQRAVDNIQFEAKKGEILGFLGPNGAGKSTTMKMICGFIPPTEGSISVCGFDTEKDLTEVQKRIGYLPEHNPLYKEMYVREYLSFIGRLHRLKSIKKKVEEVIEWTGLEREQHKHIGALSKGYRQRVGLAQALLHDPEVLILDEPTSGLDPNQLVDIRKLIKKLGQDKTVIFSTHIMQEVQAICDRVIIINRGKIVANDTIQELQQRLSGDVIVRVGFLEEVNAEQLEAIKEVKAVKAISDTIWELNSDKDIRPAIFQFAVDQGLTLIELQQRNLSVENVFQELTRTKNID